MKSRNKNIMLIFKNITSLQTLIYLLILSTLYDGVVRKWVLPQLSDILMLIKCVLAIIVLIAGSRYWNKFSKWENGALFLGVIAFITSIIVGHGNAIVAAYGCIPLLVNIPICFIIGKVLRPSDIVGIGKIFIYTAIINSVLVIVQFTLPVTHFLNFGGGTTERIEDMSIGELAGAFRPPGLFYHNSQNALFCLVAFAFMLYFYFIQKKQIRKWVLNVAIILELVSMFFTVSRTNIFLHVGMLFFCALFIIGQQNRKTFINAIIVILPLLLLASSTSIVGKAINNMEQRFENASESQYHGVTTAQGTINDIFYRSLGYHIEALVHPRTFSGEEPPFFGFGQGMSTQIGGRLLNITTYSGFSLAEWDGLRIMCESGFLLGWLIIYVRLGYVFRFLFKISVLRKKHLMMSLFLLPPFFIAFYLTSTWGNVFTSSMASIIGGLFLASLNMRNYGN